MRRVRSGCCARAARGDAAAQPSKAMKQRLFTCRLQNVRLKRVDCLRAIRQQLQNGYFCLLYRGNDIVGRRARFLFSRSVGLSVRRASEPSVFWTTMSGRRRSRSRATLVCSAVHLFTAASPADLTSSSADNAPYPCAPLLYHVLPFRSSYGV